MAEIQFESCHEAPGQIQSIMVELTGVRKFTQFESMDRLEFRINLALNHIWQMSLTRVHNEKISLTHASP